MWTLHRIDGGRRGLADATLSIGLLDPHPPDQKLRVYDFGLDRFETVKSRDVVAVGDTLPARVTFAPQLRVESVTQRMAANRRAKVIQLPVKRKRAEVPTNFVSGYDVYARNAALFWRKHGVGTQPALAAGVFALSSIRTNIVTTLKLFALLTPYVLLDELPAMDELVAIVRRSGAGFESRKTGRPAWYVDYDSYRYGIVEAISHGMRDDALRRLLATMVDVPRGLGLAKLSFTLALLGNNVGCLDGRILSHAFTPATRRRFEKSIEKAGGRFSDRAYDSYRSAELRILRDSPFYDADDPVALARAQWILWESLGPEKARKHTHEEVFRSILEPSWML